LDRIPGLLRGFFGIDRLEALGDAGHLRATLSPTIT
jgi:hypothetical protein